MKSKFIFYFFVIFSVLILISTSYVYAEEQYSYEEIYQSIYENPVENKDNFNKLTPADQERLLLEMDPSKIAEFIDVLDAYHVTFALENNKLNDEALNKLREDQINLNGLTLIKDLTKLNKNVMLAVLRREGFLGPSTNLNLIPGVRVDSKGVLDNHGVKLELPTLKDAVNVIATQENGKYGFKIILKNKITDIKGDLDDIKYNNNYGFFTIKAFGNEIDLSPKEERTTIKIESNSITLSKNAELYIKDIKIKSLDDNAKITFGDYIEGNNIKYEYTKAASCSYICEIETYKLFGNFKFVSDEEFKIKESEPVELLNKVSFACFKDSCVKANANTNAEKIKICLGCSLNIYKQLENEIKQDKIHGYIFFTKAVNSDTILADRVYARGKVLSSTKFGISSGLSKNFVFDAIEETNYYDINVNYVGKEDEKEKLGFVITNDNYIEFIKEAKDGKDYGINSRIAKISLPGIGRIYNRIAFSDEKTNEYFLKYATNERAYNLLSSDMNINQKLKAGLLAPEEAVYIRQEVNALKRTSPKKNSFINYLSYYYFENNKVPVVKLHVANPNLMINSFTDIAKTPEYEIFLTNKYKRELLEEAEKRGLHDKEKEEFLNYRLNLINIMSKLQARNAYLLSKHYEDEGLFSRVRLYFYGPNDVRNEIENNNKILEGLKKLEKFNNLIEAEEFAIKNKDDLIFNALDEPFIKAKLNEEKILENKPLWVEGKLIDPSKLNKKEKADLLIKSWLEASRKYFDKEDYKASLDIQLSLYGKIYGEDALNRLTNNLDKIQLVRVSENNNYFSLLPGFINYNFVNQNSIEIAGEKYIVYSPELLEDIKNYGNENLVASIALAKSKLKQQAASEKMTDFISETLLPKNKVDFVLTYFPLFLGSTKFFLKSTGFIDDLVTRTLLSETRIAETRIATTKKLEELTDLTSIATNLEKIGEKPVSQAEMLENLIKSEELTNPLVKKVFEEKGWVPINPEAVGIDIKKFAKANSYRIRIINDNIIHIQEGDILHDIPGFKVFLEPETKKLYVVKIDPTEDLIKTYAPELDESFLNAGKKEKLASKMYEKILGERKTPEYEVIKIDPEGKFTTTASTFEETESLGKSIESMKERFDKLIIEKKISKSEAEKIEKEAVKDAILQLWMRKTDDEYFVKKVGEEKKIFHIDNEMVCADCFYVHPSDPREFRGMKYRLESAFVRKELIYDKSGNLRKEAYEVIKRIEQIPEEEIKKIVMDSGFSGDEAKRITERLLKNKKTLRQDLKKWTEAGGKLIIARDPSTGEVKLFTPEEIEKLFNVRP